VAGLALGGFFSIEENSSFYDYRPRIFVVLFLFNLEGLIELPFIKNFFSKSSLNPLES
jgi:hypothetical protein